MSLSPAELLDAVVACDDCAEAAPALCAPHEALATEMERRAEAQLRELSLARSSSALRILRKLEAKARP